jgi:hypothetical protein
MNLPCRNVSVHSYSGLLVRAAWSAQMSSKYTRMRKLPIENNGGRNLR